MERRNGPRGGRSSYTFVQGAALLAAASLASRLIGGLARIPLTRLLGGEGMGLFQMAYVIYTLAITFAVSGVTIATSRLVADSVARNRPREALACLRTALAVALVSGAGFWLVLDRWALFLAWSLLGDVRAAPVIRAIAPSVIPVSIIAAVKGYFQGLQRMAPPAAAQVLEQLVRVTAMVWLVSSLRAEGLEQAVGGAAWANMVGATAALVVLLALLARPSARPGVGRERSRRSRRQAALGPGRLLGRFAGIAVPVAAGAALFPLTDAVQTFLVPGRLQAAGVDPRQATNLYGQLHGMAYPLAGLPAIAASALAAALVPAITEAVVRGPAGQVSRRTEAALRLTVMFSLPAAAGLVVLARPINELLFGIPEAGVPLVYVSAACVLIALQQTTAGVLQGLGRVSVPAYGLLAGLVANAAATYFLTAVPALNISGAALGIVAGFLVAAGVNLTVVVGVTGAGRDVRGLVVKPAAAAAVMAVCARTVYEVVARGLGAGNTPATLAAVGTGVVSYAAALFLLGGVRREELKMVPVIGRLVRRGPRPR